MSMSTVQHPTTRPRERGNPTTMQTSARHEPRPARIVLRPTGAAVAGIIIAALLFVVILEFLVFISFIGQRLWTSPQLFHDHWMSLPAYIWLGIVALVVAAVLRMVTQRIIVDDSGIQVRGWFRARRQVRWEDVSAMWLVRDIYRGKQPRDPVDSDLDATEAFIIMATKMRRVANVSGRFYGGRAQAILLREADERGVRVERIDHARPSELAHMLPGSQTFVDRFPNLLVLALVLIYLAHNVLTFVIWGL